MLRESATVQNVDIDVIAVVRDDADPLVLFGCELRAFADAIALLDPDELALARAELVAIAGDDVAAQAAAVCGYFAAMNRLLDATGVPMAAAFDMSAALGLTTPDHLQATDA